MVTRKYNTTEKRIWDKAWFLVGMLIVGILLVSFVNFMSGYVDRLESRIRPSDFPDLSHEVVEIVEVEEVGKTGKASWYDYSLKNHPNYSKSNFTAASRDYPRGTKLKVCRIEINITRLKGGKWQDWPCVNVRVNDYVENPKVIIDLSSAAFSKLAALSRGLIEVEVTKIE